MEYGYREIELSPTKKRIEKYELTTGHLVFWFTLEVVEGF